MACPLFLPSSRLAGTPYFEGFCAADPLVPVPGDTLRTCCNRGYARNLCGRAAETDADAFQFLVKARTFAGVEVAWSIERNHHPFAVGTLLLTGSHPESMEPLERQALAAATTLLRP